MSIIALESHLVPLLPFLRKEGVTELCINRPGEVFIERAGRFECASVPELDYRFLEGLAALTAEYNNREYPAPLLSGSLPFGERIQWVMNPACENGKIVCSIRKHQAKDISLNDYEAKGAFADLKARHSPSDDMELKRLFFEWDILGFIKKAIECRKTILISGGTGTGKTTFLNACLKHIPPSERLITVEDTREVAVQHPNTAHLLYNEEDGRIRALNVFKACLRLRPDRIFLSELRGPEAWAYLRAANSGHPGSLSTIHADSAEAAFTQLVFMLQQAGSTSSDEQIRSYVKSIINIVVQLKRDPGSERYMYVSELYYDAAEATASTELESSIRLKGKCLEKSLKIR